MSFPSLKDQQPPLLDKLSLVKGTTENGVKIDAKTRLENI